jgi:acyl-CoA reductase-like NAD-dependent aldehyde dehydrogenase
VKEASVEPRSIVEFGRMEVDSRVESRIIALRSAQEEWKNTSFKERGTLARKFSAVLAENGRSLHDAIKTPQRRNYRETLSCELLPLADSSRWLSRELPSLLKDRSVSSCGAPMWIGRVYSLVRREPFGVILVIGTWNYPIFLVGVQMLQALMAGNAVLVKPAADCEAVTNRLRELFIFSGFPEEVISVLDSSVDSAQQSIRSGVGKVILTGSTESGRAVLRTMAETLTPGVMELSGCDAMFLLSDFDEKRVIDAIVFSLRLNGGATCLAPRRIFVPRERIEHFGNRLATVVAEIPSTTLHPSTKAKLNELLSSYSGLYFRNPEPSTENAKLPAIEASLQGFPTILSPTSPNEAIAKSDIFAPIVMLMPYDKIEDAVKMNLDCAYALTASIFGNAAEASQLALKVRAGSITINDVIVPTADPRLPFGGVGQSGFGSTRGVEGLLEMTYPKVISKRVGKTLRHLEAPTPRDEMVLEGLLQCLHSQSFRSRFQGLRKMVDAIRGISRLR